MTTRIRNPLPLPTMSLAQTPVTQEQIGSRSEPAQASPGLHERLRDLLAEARGTSVEIARFEELDAKTARIELLPQVRKTVDQTQELLGDLADCLDKADDGADRLHEAPGWAFARHIDRLMASTTDAAQIADIAFVARLELRSKGDELERVEADDENDLWRLIATAGSALRRVIKATTAVEKALCEVENIEPALVFRTEVSSSISVRQIYTKTRRRLLARDRPEVAVADRLRTAATLLACLVGYDAYPLLRINDRVQLRSLHSRLLDWSRSATTDGDDGDRLWRDICGFAELLAGINQREELVVHDTRLAAELAEELSGLPGIQQVSKRLESRLKNLYGRSDQLDALLDEKGPITAARLLEILGSISSGQPNSAAF